MPTSTTPPTIEVTFPTGIVSTGAPRVQNKTTGRWYKLECEGDDISDLTPDGPTFKWVLEPEAT